MDVREQKPLPFVMEAMECKRVKGRGFVLLSLFLGGCRTLYSEQVPCPKAAIIAEFSKTINLQEGTLVRTDMDSLYPQCTAAGEQVDMEIRLRVTSFRPLLQYHAPLTLKPSYYVAVLDKAGNVLSRTDHRVEIKFKEKQTTVVNFETIREKIPSHKDVSIYIGFNLTPSQLDFLSQERKKKLLKVL